eukprot:8066728-Prorocentrum_lima.AAC.1
MKTDHYPVHAAIAIPLRGKRLGFMQRAFVNVQLFRRKLMHVWPENVSVSGFMCAAQTCLSSVRSCCPSSPLPLWRQHIKKELKSLRELLPERDQDAAQMYRCLALKATYQ